MIDLIYIVAPIFLIILLGKLLRKSLILSDDIWHQINKLTYWLLFPALLFNKTSIIDFSGYSLGTFSLSMMAGFLVSVFCAWLFSRIYGMDAPALSSVIQGSGRHNSFLALAVISQFLGEQGEIIGALAVAIMVTFSNVLTIIFMIMILSGQNGSKPSILSEIIRNPFIVSIAIGLIFNILGWGNLPILHDFTANLGTAALPLALICVGAGLRFVGGGIHIIPSLIATLTKMIILPVTVYACALYFELDPLMTACAVIFASVPTSSTAYALAKTMGGDAPLMAAIISLQTLVSVVTVPLVMHIVG
ncbi:MAG: AEC family transporter [Emcibacteraceae bacterium]